MGVTRYGCAAFEFTFEFADAAAELVVELLLLDELRGLSGERRLGAGEFLREACDKRLLAAFDARFGVRDAALDLLKVAEHGASALGVKTEEVMLVDHKTGTTSGMKELTKGG
jgi:hypothetical protein